MCGLPRGRVAALALAAAAAALTPMEAMEEEGAEEEEVPINQEDCWEVTRRAAAPHRAPRAGSRE